MRRSLVCLSLALTLTATAGCGNGDLLQPTELSAIRVYNASPDAPPVNILFRNGQIAQSLAYGFGRLYVYLAAGSASLGVQNSVGDILLDYPVTLAGGSSYTFAITGSVSALEPVLLTDDTTAAPTGSFKVRLVHLAPLGPAMDLFVTAQGADLSTATPVATGIGFKQASAYVTAPPGSVQLRLTQTGTTTVLRDVGTFTLSSGQGVTLFLIGNAGAGGGGAPYNSQLVADHVGTN
jgi:hypothetical protein